MDPAVRRLHDDKFRLVAGGVDASHLTILARSSAPLTGCRFHRFLDSSHFLDFEQDPEVHRRYATRWILDGKRDIPVQVPETFDPFVKEALHSGTFAYVSEHWALCISFENSDRV